MVTDSTHGEDGPEDLREADFPLSPLDDLMIHQTPDPVRVMWTGDPRAYERYWMACHDAAGEVLVVTGGSFYPNLDRAEAFALVCHAGRHHSVRAFRSLGVDRTDLRIGPVAPEVVEGLRRWRFVLEPGAGPVSFELDFVDTTRHVFREPLSASGAGVPPGRRNDVTTGFEGFGRVSGHVQVDGRRVEFQPGSVGTRDRHWGTGRGVGGPALALGGRLHVGTNGNAFVAFRDWTLWGDRAFRYRGDPRPWQRVGRPDRRLRFEPETGIFLEGVVDYPIDGAIRTLHYERVERTTAFMRCGMYGGTPDGGIHQGAWDGPPHVEGQSDDLDDPETRLRLAGLDQHLCRVTWEGETVLGIYQTIDPLARELCARGKTGWALL
jgi:hypothetical protein